MDAVIGVGDASYNGTARIKRAGTARAAPALDDIDSANRSTADAASTSGEGQQRECGGRGLGDRLIEREDARVADIAEQRIVGAEGVAAGRLDPLDNVVGADDGEAR